MLFRSGGLKQQERSDTRTKHRNMCAIHCALQAMPCVVPCPHSQRIISRVPVIPRDVQHALADAIVEKLVFLIATFADNNAVPAIIVPAALHVKIVAIGAIFNRGSSGCCGSSGG